MTFETELDTKKRATRAVLDEVFPLPQMVTDFDVDAFEQALEDDFKMNLAAEDDWLDIDAEMAELFGAKALMDGMFGRHEVPTLVPLTPEVAAGLEAELLASFAAYAPADGEGFPSRMGGISPDDPRYGMTLDPDDPMYELTQLVAEDAHERA